MLLIVQVALTVVLIALVAWRIRRNRAPWITAVAVLLATLVVTFWFVENSVSDGDTLCLDCGRLRRTVRVWGIPVPLTGRDLDAMSAGEAFVRAFPTACPPDHSHRWERVGCTRSGLFGRSVACRSLGHPAWFRDLAALDDRQLASATVAKYGALTREQQVVLLGTYSPSFMSVPEEQFSGWRAYWKRDHPDWP